MGRQAWAPISMKSRRCGRLPTGNAPDKFYTLPAQNVQKTIESKAMGSMNSTKDDAGMVENQ